MESPDQVGRVRRVPTGGPERPVTPCRDPRDLGSASLSRGCDVDDQTETAPGRLYTSSSVASASATSSARDAIFAIAGPAAARRRFSPRSRPITSSSGSG